MHRKFSILAVTSQGLVVDRGGYRKGKVGIVTGMVEMKGIIVGIVGSAAGRGGNVAFGIVGMVGRVGFGMVLGIGKIVVFGRVGAVGSLGNGIVGNGGTMVVGKCGSVGSVGSAGATSGE
ncbi:unnamed protein product, partial [Ilex paraguariensis]